jgi:hypothetical protein
MQCLVGAAAPAAQGCNLLSTAACNVKWLVPLVCKPLGLCDLWSYIISEAGHNDSACLGFLCSALAVCAVQIAIVGQGLTSDSGGFNLKAGPGSMTEFSLPVLLLLLLLLTPLLRRLPLLARA